MIRNTYALFVILASLLLAAGCSDSSFRAEEELLVPGSPGTITISLKNSRMSRSTASDNSETLISDIVVGLYPGGSDDNEEPVVFKTISPLSDYNSTKVVIKLTDEEIGKLFATLNTCRMYILANITGKTSVALPEKPTVAQLKELPIAAKFKQQMVQESFVMAGEGKVEYTPAEESYLQGTGTGDAMLYRAAAKIMLNLRIPRKIEIKDEEGNVTETWYSVTSADGASSAASNPLRALLNSGVDKCVAAPGIPWKTNDPEAYYYSDPEMPDKSPRYFDLTGETEEEEVIYDLFDMQEPFYTYPNTWEESAEEKYKTSITLRVPWQKENETKFTTMYYVVPITPVTLNHIDRNYSYTVKMTVGMLGSRTPDTPVEVENLSYQAVDWASEDLGIKIPDTRYLVVNPSVYTVNNESEIVIPYYSSHPVEISDISMTYERFNFYSNGDGEVVDIEIPQEKIDLSTNGSDKIVNYSLEQDPVTKQMNLRIKHDLKVWTPVNTGGVNVNLTGNANGSLNNVLNNIDHYVLYNGAEDAYSPYTINVTVSHKDNKSFNEEIAITQYPAMYITPIPNPGGGTTQYNGRAAIGNAIVNGGYIGNYAIFGLASPILGRMQNDLSSNNSNPNMYVITVSQLNEDSEYKIGDPRSPYYNNDLSGANDLVTPTQNGEPAGAYTGTNNNYNTNGAGSNWCRAAPALYPDTNTRTLTYYYPTIEDKEEYRNRIAPKFRVASSYGKVDVTVNRQGARRRMATYQELNCPAGRWRLPTYGELQYIITLSSTGKIPLLFNNNINYWTAQGACRINGDGTITLQPNTTTAYVRGIYDEWFWEQYNDLYFITPNGTNYTYTLGDMPRDPQ